MASAEIEKRPTILTVENNPEIQELIQTLLVEEGLSPNQLFFASDLNSADAILKKLTQQNSLPGLILLNLRLGQTEYGLALLHKLKGEYSLFKEIPVLIISADATAAVRDDCMRMGASGFIEKPFPENFPEIILGILNS